MRRSAYGESDNPAALAPEWPESAQGGSWIVCRGAERQVAHGRVACPTSSSSGEVAIETCLLCRHLVAIPIDRLPDGMCSTNSGPESEVRWGVL